MFGFAPKVNKISQNLLGPVLDFLHLKVGLTPNQISVFSFILSIVAAILILAGFINVSLIFIVLSLVFDAFDGAVARKFKMISKKGEMLELIFDRTSEVAIFLSLAFVGLANYKIVLLAIVAIFLMSSLRGKSKFDPGFKRIMVPVGFFIGYENAITIVFFVNMLGFIASLAALDYIYDTKSEEV